jgi:hypothetical protein
MSRLPSGSTATRAAAIDLAAEQCAAGDAEDRSNVRSPPRPAMLCPTKRAYRATDEEPGGAIVAAAIVTPSCPRQTGPLYAES